MTLADAETGEIMPFADATLEECEAVIERGLSSFVEVGNALVAIREGHKYRKTHKTFEAYCDQRWGISRPRAYELITAAEVVDSLSAMADTPVPTNERQARALAPLKSDPAAMADAMRTASRVANGNPTARDVADAVREHKPLERTTVTPNFKPGTVQPEAKARPAEPRAARRSPITDAAMSAGSIYRSPSNVSSASSPTTGSRRTKKRWLHGCAATSRPRSRSARTFSTF